MSVNLPNCKICRAPNRRRLIEADWADGMSAEGISKAMADAGWSITSQTVLRHLKEHAGPEAGIRVPPKLAKRDAAAFVRDRVMERVMELESDDGPKRLVPVKGEGGATEYVEVEFDILDKDLQPALSSMLKAQAILDKREAVKENRKIDLFLLMLGGADGKGMLAPLALTAGDDDDIIEGEARVIE